jgi:hypothetical protein
MSVIGLAQSGHRNGAAECPLSGVKRTSSRLLAMSAFDPKQTSASQNLLWRKIAIDPITFADSTGVDCGFSAFSRKPHIGKKSIHSYTEPFDDYFVERGLNTEKFIPASSLYRYANWCAAKTRPHVATSRSLPARRITMAGRFRFKGNSEVREAQLE